MRIRSIAAAFGAATLLVALGATPAAAGNGPSTYCGDGIPSSGHIELPLVNSPVTLGLEVIYDAPHRQVHICYSTTSYGAPGGVIGGEIVVDLLSSTSTTTPGAYVTLICAPDPGIGVGPITCWETVGFQADLGDVVVGTPGSGLCLSYQGVCLVEVPLVSVDESPDPSRHLLSVYVLGAWHHIDLA